MLKFKDRFIQKEPEILTIISFVAPSMLLLIEIMKRLI